GKSAIAVKQDFYARVFMLNMASMIRTQGSYAEQVKKNKKQKYTYQPNKTQVLAKVKDFLIDLFYFEDINGTLKQLLKIIKQRLEAIRTNRAYPRVDISSRRRHKGLNSKGI